VQRFLAAANNCPVRDASLAVQGRVCRLLASLLVGVPRAPGQADIEKFHDEVVDSGGVQLAVQLCQALVSAPGGQAQCPQGHALERRVPENKEKEEKKDEEEEKKDEEEKNDEEEKDSEDEEEEEEDTEGVYGDQCSHCSLAIRKADEVMACEECEWILCKLCSREFSYKGHNEVLCSALGLVVLAAKRRKHAATLSTGIAEVAEKLLDSETPVDYDAAVQAVGVLLAANSRSLADLVESELSSGLTGASGKATRPQLLAAAVTYSLNHDSLEPRLLQDILRRYPEQPFPWRRLKEDETLYEPPKGVPSAYHTLGGLCLHALLEQRRKGVKFEEDTQSSPHAEEWRWQLRSPREFFEDLRAEVQHEGRRGSYTPELYEEQFQKNGCSEKMVDEFNRLWDEDSQVKTFPTLVEAIVSSGCLAALRDGCCASDPKEKVLSMLDDLVARVAQGIGTHSPAMAQVAMVLSNESFLQALPRLIASEKHKEYAHTMAMYLCPVQALGPKMVKVLQECIKSDISKSDLSSLAGPLCASDRNARQLRQSGLLELMLPQAIKIKEEKKEEGPDKDPPMSSSPSAASQGNDEEDDDDDDRYDAIGAVCALLESETSDAETLKKITSSDAFMEDLVGSMHGQRGEPWETFRPPLNLAEFQVGRTALVKHGAVKKLSAYIAKQLKEVNSGTVDQTKMRALDYAMQTLLLLMSDSKEAVDQLMQDTLEEAQPTKSAEEEASEVESEEEKAVTAESFRALVEGVSMEVPSLFQQATELKMYWRQEEV